MHNVEEIIQSLVNEVENLNKELQINRKLYAQEHQARLDIAKELEKAQETIARLQFFLENA